MRVVSNTAARQIERATWVLVFVGMVLSSLGLSVSRSDAALGWGIGGPGIAAVTVGIALIWVRSRLKLPKETG